MSYIGNKTSTDDQDMNVPELSSGHSTQHAKGKVVDLLDEDAVDGVYRAKMHVVNDAMQQIGMGRYQVRCSCYLHICIIFSESIFTTYLACFVSSVGTMGRRRLRLLCGLGLAASLRPRTRTSGGRDEVQATVPQLGPQHWSALRRYLLERRE
jgi:hypothetical protein